ncbi:MAG: glycosyltransferase family 4 protein [Syntrophobacteraceae bacterium]|nr:glycosyltransferase family 4 protein [Syntrophobacteraceae bacterium]
MRIALYCPNKPLNHPHPSGDLVIAQGIHLALNRLGHDCREIVRFRSRWFWKDGSGWAGAARAWLQAWPAAHAFKPQIWMTYHTYYKSPDVIGPWISRLLRIPYVIFQPMYATRRRRSASTSPGFRLNRWAILRAHHVFSNNLRDLEALRRILPEHRITYLPPGIWPEQFPMSPEAAHEARQQFGIPPRRFLILTAARWREGVKTESFLYLLKALAKLREDLQSFTLLVIGDGPMEPLLRKRAAMELPGQAVFAGRIPRESMYRLYSAADVFAFPGIGESLGMVFLEAQSCGLPVVALAAAGVPQVVVDGATGILVPPDDGHAMARALRLLAADPALRRMMGQGGARFVREERNLHRNTLQLSQKLVGLAEGIPRGA